MIHKMDSFQAIYLVFAYHDAFWAFPKLLRETIYVSSKADE